MAKIKLNWEYAKGELDTDTMELKCIPARGKRAFGLDELDAGLCIKDGGYFTIAEIHLGDVESSNILCQEITKRFNAYKGWNRVEDNLPEVDTQVLVVTKDGEYRVTQMYNPIDCYWDKSVEKVWSGTKRFTESITHWKEIEPVELEEE